MKIQRDGIITMDRLRAIVIASTTRSPIRRRRHCHEGAGKTGRRIAHHQL